MLYCLVEKCNKLATKEATVDSGPKGRKHTIYFCDEHYTLLNDKNQQFVISFVSGNPKEVVLDKVKLKDIIKDN